ncbi:MAG: hypothetical protein HC906_07975 [Bacteroidales bacterium]|nr:hypothetical protein [Bacteroidales bacterium]
MKNAGNNIQWEVSEDKQNWKELPGENMESLVIHVDSSAYYRARILKSNTCPFYSDTILIAEIYDERTGQQYDGVQMGPYFWMAENLNFYTPTGSYFYHNDSVNYSAFGRLYKWQIAQNVCMDRWHLPSDKEWFELEMSVGLSVSQVLLSEWRGTDQAFKLFPGGSSGFNVQFGGQKYPEGFYQDVINIGTYWTSSSYSDLEAWYRGFNTAHGDIHRYYYSKDFGFSVRCVKNRAQKLRSVHYMPYPIHQFL